VNPQVYVADERESVSGEFNHNLPWQILEGDVRDVLRTLPEKHFHCCVTSPPYWGLRDYGLPPSVWGGNSACAHEWGSLVVIDRRGLQTTPSGSLAGAQIADARKSTRGSFCKCGAWFGCLGLEPTPEQFVANMVEVFREVWRVLRDDATLWLNIGDSYNAYNGGAGPGSKLSKVQSENRPAFESGYGLRCKSLKPKDLVGIPWMLAFALRADGWYLRSEVIWHKRAPMPESVRDRPTKAHEQVFLLSKSQRYFYDSFASAEKVTGGAHSIGSGSRQKLAPEGSGCRNNPSFNESRHDTVEQRNMRSVWTLSPESFAGAHFATMPTELVRLSLLAGTADRGCCSVCGRAAVRLLKKERKATRDGSKSKVARVGIHDDSPYQSHSGDICGNRDPQRHCTVTETVGWEHKCDCLPVVPAPCRVLDPFSGAGTTTMVARRLGLHAVGIELNPEYAEMSRKRIRDDQPLLNAV